MLKKILITGIIGSTLVLGGCFGGGNSDSDAGGVLPSENFATFDNKEVSIQYPANWKLKSGNQINTDLQDSVVAIMTSNFRDPFFTPVITVERVAVGESVGSVNFAEATIEANEEELVSYEELERKDITTLIGAGAVNTKLVRFRGKQGLDGQVLEFLQIFLVKDGIGYTVTAAYDPNDEENEAAKLVQSLETFSLK